MKITPEILKRVTEVSNTKKPCNIDSINTRSCWNCCHCVEIENAPTIYTMYRCANDYRRIIIKVPKKEVCKSWQRS